MAKELIYVFTVIKTERIDFLPTVVEKNNNLAKTHDFNSSNVCECSSGGDCFV